MKKSHTAKNLEIAPINASSAALARTSLGNSFDGFVPPHARGRDGIGIISQLLTVAGHTHPTLSPECKRAGTLALGALVFKAKRT